MVWRAGCETKAEASLSLIFHTLLLLDDVHGAIKTLDLEADVFGSVVVLEHRLLGASAVSGNIFAAVDIGFLQLFLLSLKCRLSVSEAQHPILRDRHQLRQCLIRRECILAVFDSRLDKQN